MTNYDPLLGKLINTIPLSETEPFEDKGKIHIFEEGIVFEEEDGATLQVFYRYINDIVFLEKALYDKYLCQLIYKNYIGNETVRNLYINVDDYNYIREKVKA
jgi:hypothetical protein